MTGYIVHWRHRGALHLIDFDNEVAAHAVAVALAETGRTDVTVTATEEEVPEDIRARIKERVARRIEEEAWRPLMGAI